MQLRPPVDLVDALQRLYPRCGMATANELAVALIEQGVKLLEEKETASIPAELRRFRALLHGEPVEEVSSVPSPEALREMVRDLMREELGLVLEEAKQADLEEPTSEPKTAQRTARAKRPRADSKPPSREGS